MPFPNAADPFLLSPSPTSIWQNAGLGAVTATGDSRIAGIVVPSVYNFQTGESSNPAYLWLQDRSTGTAGTTIALDMIDGDTAGLPQIVTLSNGGMVVWWQNWSASTAPFSEHMAVVLDANGTAQGSSFLLGGPTTGGHVISALENGGYLHSWVQQSAGNYNLMICSYTATGVAGPTTTVATLAYTGGGDFQVAELPDNGFLAEWTLADGTLVARGFNADGTPSTAQFTVQARSSTDHVSANEITVLADGTALFTWRTSGLAGDDVHARLFSADGTSLGGAFNVATDTTGGESYPVVVALADGGFAVMWMDDPDATYGDDGPLPITIRGQIFDGAGTRVGDEFSVMPDGLSTWNGFTAAALADGRFSITYTLSDGAGNLETWVRTFDPRLTGVSLTGDTGADDFQGSAYADRLVGAAGSDSLYGNDGTDTLNGGDGDDLLLAGATSADLRDLAYGGNGNDSIDGGWGNDELNGGNGNDTVAGDFGADTLVGNAGDDTLLGAAGSDLIFGNDGIDFINGGFGFDRLNGGSGADKFYHAGVTGHGSDWIQDYSSEEGDVLVVGLAGATRDQFQINFAETANAGAAGVQEAFVIYSPTGQILWALVDGGAQTSINLQIGGQVYDLLT